MIEKPLYIIIFMYTASFSLIGMQYLAGDVYGVTLTNFEGTPINSNLLEIVNVTAINESQLEVVNTNETEITTDPITGAAGIAWELFQLLTGTYVFNVLYLMGIPSIIVGGMVLIYVIMLARTLIAYIRGI